MNVSVSQCPIGTSPTKRSPRGFQPLGRTMLVLTAVSSINTRRAGSSKPCSRTQRRPPRAPAGPFRSAACRLFFDGDVVAGEESGKRASACRDSPLSQRQDHLIQDEVRMLTNESEDALRVLLQWRGTPSTGHWLGSPVVKEALHPPDRGTDADVEFVCRLTPGPSSFHEPNDSHSQLTSIRSTHRPILRRINALDSHLRRALGIPIHSGWDAQIGRA